MNPSELRDSSIRLLAGAAADLQRQVAKLEKENAALRTENKRLRAGERYQKAMAKVAGK